MNHSPPSISHAACIFISGAMEQISQTCREYTICGLCVSVTPTQYIFTGGSEAGAIVGLINYPRFPASPEQIEQHAKALAEKLMDRCVQRSCTIQTPSYSYYMENENIITPR